MTPVLIGVWAFFEGSNRLKMEEKQVPGIYVRMCMYIYIYILYMHLHVFLFEHLANRQDMDDELEPVWDRTLNQFYLDEIYVIYIHICIGSTILTIRLIFPSFSRE